MTEDVFTAERVQALKAPLDPRRVSTMEVQGRVIPYLEAHDVIETANRIFGFGNWGFEAGTPWVHRDVDKSDKPFAVWMCLGTLTVKGGLQFTDLGTNLQSGPGGPATEMSAKGAVSDALKRCFKQYGNQFGLPLYDKETDRTTLEREYRQAHKDESLPFEEKAAEVMVPEFPETHDWLQAFHEERTKMGFAGADVARAIGKQATNMNVREWVARAVAEDPLNCPTPNVAAGVLLKRIADMVATA